jgi:ribosomal protein L11 methyltransferase
MLGDATNQDWLELKVVCEAEAVDAVAELFARYGFSQGIVVEDAAAQTGDCPLFAVDPDTLVTVSTRLGPGDVPPEELEDTRRMLWVLRQQLWILGRSRLVGALAISERPEDDWPNAWKADYTVHRVGRQVLTRAPWHDYVAQPGETVITLDPATAFGTGRHPSTQLCMEALEDELTPGDRVLDVGIGAGVLATAAALLGASAVEGVDIDPVAVRAARETAERNGVEAIVRVALGSIGPDGPFPAPCDLVIANIIARVLVELAPDLARAVMPGGTLILGGILDDREAFVREAFARQDVTFVRRATNDDWVSLVYRKAA